MTRKYNTPESLFIENRNTSQLS